MENSRTAREGQGEDVHRRGSVLRINVVEDTLILS